MITDKNANFLMMFGPDEIREKGILDKEKYPKAPMGVVNSPLLSDEHAKLLMKERIEPEIKEGYSQSLVQHVTRSPNPHPEITSRFVDIANNDKEHGWSYKGSLNSVARNKGTRLDTVFSIIDSANKSTNSLDHMGVSDVTDIVMAHGKKEGFMDRFVANPNIHIGKKNDAIDRCIGREDIKPEHISHENIKTLIRDTHKVSDKEVPYNTRYGDLLHVIETKYDSHNLWGKGKVPGDVMHELIHGPNRDIVSHSHRDFNKSLSQENKEFLMKHHDDGIRYTAIKHYGEEDHLIHAAKNDTNEQVRKLAREKLRLANGELSRTFFEKHGITTE